MALDYQVKGSFKVEAWISRDFFLQETFLWVWKKFDKIAEIRRMVNLYLVCHQGN